MLEQVTSHFTKNFLEMSDQMVSADGLAVWPLFFTLVNLVGKLVNLVCGSRPVDVHPTKIV